MVKISRRKALKYLITGTVTLASGQFLGACQVKKPESSPVPSPVSSPDPSVVPSRAVPPTQLEQSTQSVTQQTSANTADPSIPTGVSYPDLVVARGGEPDSLVRAAFSTLGGLERFIPKGGWVIIKPNICTAYHTFEYAATTNPWVVGTLVKMCFESGAKKVQVMDFPFGGSARDAYKISGISEQVEKSGGEMVQMSDFKFKPTTIDNALSLTEVGIYEDVFMADTLINVPIAKNHGLATLTMGMKNLMGLIKKREQIHRDFGNRLTDLAGKIKPTLTVVDAVRILYNNGPTGGNLDDVRKLDTVIVSADIVAADSYGASLFGMQPNDLEYIRVATQMGLGRSDLSTLNIKELTVGS